MSGSDDEEQALLAGVQWLTQSVEQLPASEDSDREADVLLAGLESLARTGPVVTEAAACHTVSDDSECENMLLSAMVLATEPQSMKELPALPAAHEDPLAAFVNRHIADSLGDFVPSCDQSGPVGHSRARTLGSVLRDAFAPAAANARSNDSMALVLQALEDEQHKGVEQVLNKLGSGSFFFVSRRFDEATHYVQYTPAVSAKALEWLLESLHADTFLSQDNIAELSQGLQNLRCGVSHFMVQRTCIRWGQGPKESSVVITRPMLIQRTSASNIRSALDTSHPALSFKHLLEHVAPRVGVLVLHMACDSASANVRVMKELADELQHFPNTVLLCSPCLAHQAGIITQACIDRQGVLNNLFSVCKILKQAEYHDRWLASMSVWVAVNLDYILLDAADAQARRSASERRIDFICKITLLRPGRVRSAAHPNAPQPKKAAKNESVIRQQVLELKRYWHPCGRGVGLPTHFCDGSKQKCQCGTSAEECKVHMAIALANITSHLVPTNTPAQNRWESTAPILTFLTFLALIGWVGPRAWLCAWPLDEVSRRWKANEELDNDFVRETSRRLLAASIFFADEAQQARLTIMHVVLFPMDQLLRYMQNVDASEHKDLRREDGMSPLILRFADPAGPLHRAQAA